jgi:hypothetical protein
MNVSDFRPVSLFRLQLAHMRLRWYLYLPVFAIWVLAYLRLFADPMPHVPVLFNWTGSLPCHVAWLQSGSPSLTRGDYVVFAFDGEAKQSYPGLRGQPFFKIIRGLPGTFAPTYHELQCEKTVCPADAFTWAVHAAWASGVASMLARSLARSHRMHPATQSTCCSICMITLVKADGLPGPTSVNKLGNPATVRPR